MRLSTAAAFAVFSAVAASRAAAQQDTTAVTCNGQLITDIVVRASAPTAAILRRVPILARAVAAVHTTTHASVIERFMLLQVGDKCDELRRAESERILRAQPFLAEASITVERDTVEKGGVILDVRTSDEVALVLGLAAVPGSPFVRFARVGDANLSGLGMYLAADWINGYPFRNGYGGRFVDNQLFGRPYTFVADGYVLPLGSTFNFSATHPFYTDIQRIAWRAGVGADDDYVQFRNNDSSSHAIRLTRNFFDVGGIVRLGPPGRLSLFGASISGDDERPGANQVLVTPRGFAHDTSTQLLGRYIDHRIARINALWGIRDLGFSTVRGFDALSGTQDLAVGFQLGSIFGRSLSVLGSRDDDIFMAGDLYIGQVGINNALRMQLQAEARRDNDRDEWDGILATGRAIEYLKFWPQQTTTLTLEFSGGWQQRIPFNLTLSDPAGGLRGFSSSNTPGGQRFVTRIDNRVFVGRPFNLADFGIGAFADAGRLWAGGIPYGVSTPMYSSVGVSLLGAVPPRSARIWRVDLAYAWRQEPGGHRFELRVSNNDKTTFFLVEPSDIGATRERTVPSSIFRWPQ